MAAARPPAHDAVIARTNDRMKLKGGTMGGIRHHLRSNIVGYIALFFALSTGSAVALSGSNTVFTDDVANDTQPASGGNPAGGLVAADLRPNSVGSSEVSNGSIASGDLTAAARGARAYARVNAEGSVIPSKNISDTTHFNNQGIYCFTLVGIDPASAVVIVSADYFGDSTTAVSNRASVAEWDSDAPDCPGQMEVRTFVDRSDSTDNNDGSGSGPGDDLVSSDEAFSFVVP
jgi:hypothetical protein